MGLATIVSASLLALRLFSLPAVAAPNPAVQQGSSGTVADNSNSNWWMSSIQRQGKPAFGGANYKVYRNVKDYGAKGDGSSDDTAAINNAITDGQRCGQGCDSSTTTPALVYFPPGTYVVSKPIIQYYYTQLVGDAVNVPTLKAAANFAGIAVVDSDPYDNFGNNWYTNQNNFFRQVRNFKIDLTGLPKSTGTGIHWQVAQATSLQNIEFNMIQDKSSDNKQQGVFMDNGSGGFMTDLTFNGGSIGAFLGNQQFTTRNLKFNNCNTAIYMNWNWLWTFHGVSIKNCGIGINMANGGDVQTVGSVILVDSSISDTPIGITTVYNPGQSGTNGTLVLDNVDMTKNVPVAVQNGGNKQTILPGNALISSWTQGRSYSGVTGKASQGPRNAVAKPAALTDSSGKIVTRSKPQYNDVPASKFVSVKSKGAKGDGKTDDTAAIQAIFDSIGSDQIVYFDHGAYVITNTVKVPKNVKVVGEIWPLILAGGNSNFKDMSNPKPVFQVGQAGDVGNVEMSDLIFETQGPQPGAILMEFNVAGQSKGSAGLWDVHFRIGGSAGTQLQSDKCSKTPKVQTSPNPECIGAFMMMHVTKTGSPYFENTWFWVADHELDLGDHNQINIYNGRGVLIESTKGAWLFGTAAEHCQLYNYQLTNAQNVYMALIQTETAYMQGNPDARVPFPANSKFSDPDFSKCTGPKCARTWGLRAQNSSGVFVYGGGLYSFFDNYAQECVSANNCQDSVISIESSKVEMFGISTKASISMVNLDGQATAKDADNRNNFCAAIAAFESS
ncbi:hypothetical protein QQS21_000556 [Conoideocrella luteorostrata]|uniref:Rhamnogalacturonase A/B/Epimerase-like pectate lyase domain-containing protein n=1 Tax=Conoideocrella luteorostrata TaxID=1105319 RepID=A0AAJ0CYP2_9HYPO|nr:hypothetical protein QQS21_000556 [Conoideocrella luteorostrata]